MSQASTKLIHQATLILSLIICIGIAISVMLWASEPEMRPLKADITLSEAIKVTQALEQYEITYKLSLARHYIAVDSQDYARAVVAAKSIGIEMPSPPKYSAELVKAMESAKLEEDYLPIFQQPWFLKLFQ